MSEQITTSLDQLTTIIHTYHSATEPTGEMLNEFIKDVSSLLFYLTNERIKAHKRWNHIMFKRGDNSVASQKIWADEQVPELYQLRHIIKAGFESLAMMRSNLTSARKEREYTSQQT